MAFSLGEYQDIFLEEADGQLQELNQNLLELEKNPEDNDIINNIFRAAHSLKSSAAFVGLNELSDLAHKMENLLQGIRDKTMQINPEIIDVLFSCFDVISSVIDSVGSGKKPDHDFSEIMFRIQSIGENKPVRAAAPGTAAVEVTVPRTVLSSKHAVKIREGVQAGRSCCELTIFIDPSAPMKWVKAQLIQHNLERLGSIVITVPSFESLNENSMSDILKVVLLTDSTIDDVRKSCDIDMVTRVDLKRITIDRKDDKTVLKFGEKETLVEETAVKNQDNGFVEMSHTLKEQADKEVEDDEDEDHYKDVTLRKRDDKKAVSLKIVKVSVDKLDMLLNNVGELVIANSGFYRLYEELRKANYDKNIVNEFKNRMDQMSRIAKDLQSGIMKTRMVPIGQVFSRFNRLVRDLAKEFGKNLRLEIKGEETELDKKVIDAIGEPLMHLLRNAIDHGIETVEERRRLNKSEVATLSLNAYQAGNQIFIQVSDDGRGLNLPKIRKKAVEKGLATAEMLANLDDDDIYNFIYAPGFSTADVVTDISGRGVGMNVVKEIVTELNGSIGIETEVGMGTRFILSFPLTLAIIPAIMVRVQKERYAIPLSDVIETIKISYADLTTIEGHEVINLRGEILSLIRLNDFVGIRSGLEDDKRVPVVVVGYGNRKIGIIVDYLEGKLEIVIKSLDQNYANVEGLAGASILGDGSICLILDIASMINKVIYEQEKITRSQRQRFTQVKEARVEEVAEIKDVPKAAAGDRRQTSAADAEKPAPPKREGRPARPDVKVKEDVVFRKEPERAETEAVKSPEPEKPVFLEKPAIAETRPVPDEAAVEKMVHETLQTFKEDLREQVKATVESGMPDEHIRRVLDVDEDDIARIRVLSNVGITNAAESLSKIVGKQIDLSIPNVAFMPLEKIPETVGEIDSIYIGVYMPLMGEIKGTILFSVVEHSGFELIDSLYGLGTEKTKELTEDGESALKEVTNIIGSSMINAFSEKTGIAIQPSVPTVVHDYMQSILDSILVVHNVSGDYALIMDTEFFYQDDRFIGKLMMMPEIESLKKIVERLR